MAGTLGASMDKTGQRIHGRDGDTQGKGRKMSRMAGMLSTGVGKTGQRLHGCDGDTHGRERKRSRKAEMLSTGVDKTGEMPSSKPFLKVMFCRIWPFSSLRKPSPERTSFTKGSTRTPSSEKV